MRNQMHDQNPCTPVSLVQAAEPIALWGTVRWPNDQQEYGEEDEEGDLAVDFKNIVERMIIWDE